MNNLHRVLLGPALVLFISNPAGAQNWPQFLGPDASMIVEKGNPPIRWSEQNKVAWTYEMRGESWGTPVIWEDRIYVSYAEMIPGEDISRQEGDQGAKAYSWQVSCVDLVTGKELWKREARRAYPRVRKHGASNYACETPVTDGERLYVYFGMHGLYCYDMTGELIWSKDLGAYETQRGWGTGSSPVLWMDRLFIQADSEEESFLVALDKHSGEELWRVNRDENTRYSTPYIWKNTHGTELVTGGKSIRSYKPENGELIWELQAEGANSIPSAIGTESFLIAGNVGFLKTPATLFCIRAGAQGDISPAEGDSISQGVLWSRTEADLGNPSPLLYEGLLYILGSRKGLFHCYDPSNGQRVYSEEIEDIAACWASPWAHDGKVFFTDARGSTCVIKAGREFELLHRNKLDDKFWSSVAASGDSYLFKGLEKMYCIR